MFVEIAVGPECQLPLNVIVQLSTVNIVNRREKLTSSKIAQGQIGALLRARIPSYLLDLHRLEALQKTKTVMPSPFHLLDHWKAVSGISA